MRAPHHALPPAIVDLELRPGADIYGPDGPRHRPVDRVRATVKTTLMERHVSGAALAHSEARAMVFDRAGLPALLLVEPDGQLVALRAEGGRHRGWVRTPVGGLPAGARVKAVTACRRSRGSFVAVITAQPGQSDHVRVAEQFEVESADEAEWQDWGWFADGEGRALACGQFMRGDGPSLVALTSSMVYRVLGHGRWAFVAHCSPGACDVQVGQFFEQNKIAPAVVWREPDRGARGDTVIAWIDRSGVIRQRSSHPICLLPTGVGETLHASANTIYRMRVGRREALPSIDGDGDVVGLHCVWSRPGRLRLLARTTSKLWLFDDSARWRWDCIAGDVAGVSLASILTDVDQRGLDVFITDGEHLAALRRDEQTGHFRRTEIALPHGTGGHTVLTGTTRIRLTDADGHPLPKVPLHLKVESECYLSVNGHAVVAEAGHELPVATDGAGVLEVVKHLHGLAMPTMRLANPALAQTLSVDPMAHLAPAIESAHGPNLDDIVLDPGGSRERHLVPPHRRGKGRAGAETALSMASHMREMAQRRRRARTGVVAEAADLDALREGVAAIEADAPKTLDLGEYPFGRGCWTVDLGGGEGVFTAHDPEAPPAFFAEAEAQLIEAQAAREKGLFDALGAFLQHLVHEAVSLVKVSMKGVRDGLHVIFHGIETFFVRTLEALADVARAVLHNLLGIDLDAIVQWLGFVFDWQDIKRTHAAVRRGVDHCIAQVRSGLPRLRAAAEAQIQTVVAQIDAIQLPPKIAEMRLDQVLGLLAPEQVPPPARQTYHTLNGLMSHHPGAHWVGSALAHGPQPEADALDRRLDAKSDFEALFAELARHAGGLQTHLRGQQSALEGITGDRSLTVGQIFEVIRGVLRGGVAVLQVVSTAILDAIEGIAEAVLSLLTRPLRMPLLSFMWKSVLGMPGELTVIDLLLLPLAVPATIITKLITGKPPIPATYSAGDVAEWPDERTRALWGAFFGGVATAVFESLIAVLDVAWADTNPVGSALMVIMHLVSVIMWCPALNPLPSTPELVLHWTIWVTWLIDAGLRVIGAIISVGFALPADLVLGMICGPVLFYQELALIPFAVTAATTKSALAQAILRGVQAVVSAPGPSIKALIAVLVAAEQAVAAIIFEGIFIVQRGLEELLYWARVIIDALRYTGDIKDEPLSLA